MHFTALCHVIMLARLVYTATIIHIHIRTSLQDGRTFSYCGTVEYMPPEIVSSGDHGHDLVSCKHVTCTK